MPAIARASIQALVEFKALDVTPEWIGGFVRIGYGNLPPDELVQLKALDITPDFVAGFDRAGYRRLPVETLGPVEGARTSRPSSSAPRVGAEIGASRSSEAGGPRCRP